MKPICVPCERFMRPKRNGYHFLEGMPDGTNEKQAIGKGADGWSPYKLWVGDLWECPTCKHQLVSGVSFQPIAEHYQDGFAEKVEAYGAGRLLVKDC
jgi:hypothetical protein